MITFVKVNSCEVHASFLLLFL